MTRVAARRRTTAKPRQGGTNGTSGPSSASERYGELKLMLLARQRELVQALRGTIRSVCTDGSGAPSDVVDEAEASQVDSQADVDFALLAMKAETLDRITAALSHLEAGSYGRCQECDDEIAEARLRALPFATRCRDCEDAREQAQARQRGEPRLAGTPVGFSFDRGSVDR